MRASELLPNKKTHPMIMGSCSAHVLIPQSCGISSEDYDKWGMILLLYTRVQLNTENVRVGESGL